MIKTTVWILMTAATLILTGCASQMSIQAQPNPEQKTSYVAGQPVILSEKKYSVVVSQSSSQARSNERLSFLVYLLNNQDLPINFGTENITASLNGQLIKVFNHEEVIAQMESERNAQMLSMALAGLGQTMSATGQQQHFGTMSSQYHGSQGYSGQGLSTYSGTTYNPTAAAVAQSNIQAQTQQNIGNISQTHNQEIANTRSALLATETVYPGNNHGGYILTEQLGGSNSTGTLTLTVAVGGELHSFDFSVGNN